MLDLLISIQRGIQSAISSDITAFSTDREWLAHMPLVRGINPRKMAAIMADMDPVRAQALTVLLAQAPSP